MAILNKYYTTWTSDDSQMYKLEIIETHSTADAQDTITSGFVELELPDDFLLKDMTFEASLGDIPIGIATQTLRLNINLGSRMPSGANYATLATKILRGTDSECAPIDSSNSIIGTSDFLFKCFNTYILSRSDDGGTTYNPIFIGCQKFAAETDVEITKLTPIVKISIEVYDIGRCIGEIVKPLVWFYYLRCKHELVSYGSQCTTDQYEDKEYTFMDIAYNFGEQPSNYNYLASYYMYNRLVGGLSYKIQKFSRLYSKMELMYTEHMRSILCSDCNYIIGKETTVGFYTLSTPTIAGTSLDQFGDVCILSEINDPKFSDSEYSYIYGNCLGGMLRDKDGFGQYTNFHEILNNIAENFLHKGSTTYTYSGSYYSADLYLDRMLPFYSSNFTVQASTVYDTVKFKLFNETLNTCKTVVSNIQGDSDTTEWTYSKQATSGDNSKDIKLLFHNLPIITNGAIQNNPDFTPNPPERLRFESNNYYRRNTMNVGTLCYLSEDEEVRKVDTNCTIIYSPLDHTLTRSLAIDRDQKFIQQVITEQQNSGLPLTLAYALIFTMSPTTFKTLEFKTTSKANDSSALRGILPEKFGRAATVSYGINPLLTTWDPPSPAISTRSTIVNYSLDIYTGMADVKLIVHGLQVEY